MIPFAENLERRGLSLRRGRASGLQINLGLRCNQACAHCRLDAGPARAEIMSRRVMEQVADYAGRCRFETVDLTGGAPELHPGLPDLVRMLAPRAGRVVLRSNLTALLAAGEPLMSFLAGQGTAVAASFPALTAEASEAQRGRGTFRASIECLRRLNGLGYGHPGSGLVLDLVANPSGPSLPRPESELEEEFRVGLGREWGIVFNRLYSFTNVPLGRFRGGLAATAELDGYMDLLSRAFNERSLEGLMCRSGVAVDWKGYVYDCDFNLPTGLYLGGARTSVAAMDGPPPEGQAIAVGDHCYACTAGSGFT